MDLAINLDPGLKGSPSFGDLLMQNGDLTLTADAVGGTTHPVLQDVTIRLRTYLGEYFINNQLGMPWHQLALDSQVAQTQLDAVIQNCITTTPGILQLSTYESSLNRTTRLLSISFTAASTHGPVSYSTSVQPQNQSAGGVT